MGKSLIRCQPLGRVDNKKFVNQVDSGGTKYLSRQTLPHVTFDVRRQAGITKGLQTFNARPHLSIDGPTQAYYEFQLGYLIVTL